MICYTVYWAQSEHAVRQVYIGCFKVNIKNQTHCVLLPGKPHCCKQALRYCALLLFDLLLMVSTYLTLIYWILFFFKSASMQMKIL